MATQDFEAAPTDRAGEHPLIRRTRHALEQVDGQIADLERQRAKQAEQVRQGLKPALVRVVINDLLGEGGVIVPSPEALSITVTPGVRDRALAVMSALMELLRDRKLRAWIENGKTRVGHDKYSFALRLSEIAEKAPGQRRDLAEPIRWWATGRLRITLREGPVGDFRIRDEKGSPIEAQLEVLADFVHQAVGYAPERQRKQELEMQAQRAEAERLAALEAEAQRIEAERRRLLAEETARREELMNEVARWHESVRLRTYVDAILSHAGIVEPGSAVDQWARWARGVADAIDPIPKRMEGFGGVPPARCPSGHG
ncbi:hypothetical protein HFK83_01580 [Ralstonia pseudosolanacearum]|uniref:hypothetical protein n=1 Tax=Ralstonia solanacearum species complex TaxID=3116862 RepID=UPI0003660A3E|nr:hypothetical protein [Ralstonia pseudosolanacearum]MCK4121076.1 hypothetical protein [Ralstonia pseudosolanacearum]